MSWRLRVIKAIARWLARRGKAWALARPDGSAYLTRFVLLGATPEDEDDDKRSVWLHNLSAPDADPYEHDHPFAGFSVIVSGQYIESRGPFKFLRKALGFNLLRLGELHRIESVAPDTWSIFFATRTHGRPWGFEIDGRWVQWREAKDAGLIKTSRWVKVDEHGRPFEMEKR